MAYRYLRICISDSYFDIEAEVDEDGVEVLGVEVLDEDEGLGGTEISLGTLEDLYVRSMDGRKYIPLMEIIIEKVLIKCKEEEL